MVLQGSIVGLQVQSGSLKVGDAPNRRYDPDPLVAVSSLTVTQDGVCGWTSNGEKIVDVHNKTHPASRNRDGANGVSIGFTSHYGAMRQNFGHHLGDGLAGENILVQLDDMVLPEELSGEMLIRSTSGEEVRLVNVVVAAPCVEFARFVLNFPDGARPDRRVTEAVRFLHHGMRGYYASYSDSSEATIELGNRFTIV